jgi:opacity protein-like surface antigen
MFMIQPKAAVAPRRMATRISPDEAPRLGQSVAGARESPHAEQGRLFVVHRALRSWRSRRSLGDREGEPYANVTTAANITGSNGNTNSGRLLGAGVEWAFANNWSAKIEYDYLGLSSQTFAVPAGSPFLAGDTFTTNSRSVQMVKAGVNFLFNGGRY